MSILGCSQGTCAAGCQRAVKLLRPAPHDAIGDCLYSGTYRISATFWGPGGRIQIPISDLRAFDLLGFVRDASYYKRNVTLDRSPLAPFYSCHDLVTLHRVLYLYRRLALPQALFFTSPKLGA